MFFLGKVEIPKDTGRRVMRFSGALLMKFQFILLSFKYLLARFANVKMFFKVFKTTRSESLLLPFNA